MSSSTSRDLGHLQLVPPARCVRQVDEARAEIDRQLQLLSYRRNSLSPVSFLPREILSEIFLVYAHSDGRLNWQNIIIFKRARSLIANALCVSHVCQHWRTISHSMHRLWNILVPSKMELTEHFLALSAPMPVRIFANLDADTVQLSDSVVSALTRLDRAQEVVLRTDRTVEPDICRALDRRAPLLETLIVTLTNARRDQQCGRGSYAFSLPAGLTNRHIPCLRDVELTGCYCDWNSPIFAGLTSLCLDAIPENSRLSLSQYRAMIAASPKLHRLSMFDAVRISADDERSAMNQPTIALSHLESVDMAAETGLHCAILLHFLSLEGAALSGSQASGRITLTMSRTPLARDFTALCSAMQSFGRHAPRSPTFSGLQVFVESETASFLLDQQPTETNHRTFFLRHPSVVRSTVDMVRYLCHSFNLTLLSDVTICTRTSEQLELTFLEWELIHGVAPLVERIELVSSRTDSLISALSWTGNKVSDSNEMRDAGKARIFPKLKHLVLTGIDLGPKSMMQVFAAALRHRRADGHQLDKLEVYDCTFSDFEDLRAFKRAVGTFIFKVGQYQRTFDAEPEPEPGNGDNVVEGEGENDWGEP